MFEDWIGRSETLEDELSPAPLAGLAALLDYEAPPWKSVPPLGHWLYFLPRARQSEIDIDGHPKRGGFLPPIASPRRMWAGGRLKFHAALPIGAQASRKSTIKSIAQKSGASGEMVFVTVAHEVNVDGAVAMSEEQDIVFRAAATGPAPLAPGSPAAKESSFTRPFAPDAVSLFRFSALTFNGHRIHYDRPYATESEFYPGLVVHGPFIATALMDHFLRRHSGAQPRSFSFRAQRPLFDGDRAALCLADGEVWCQDGTGSVVMRAEVGA